MDLGFKFAEGEPENLEWRERLKVTVSGESCKVLAKLPDGRRVKMTLPKDQCDLVKADPMDKRNFSANYDPNGEGTSEINPEDTIQAVMQKAREYPLLSADGERILLLRMALGDNDARMRLFRSSMQLVLNIAFTSCLVRGDYRHILDVAQVGNIGLMKALEKFDVTKKNPSGEMIRLSSYATHKIKREITLYWVKYGKTIRIPEKKIYFAITVGRVRKALDQLGETVTQEALAFNLLSLQSQLAVEEAEVDVNDILSSDNLDESVRREFALILKKIKQLDAIPGTVPMEVGNGDDDGFSLLKVIPDSGKGPEEVVEGKDTKDHLVVPFIEQLKDQLTPTEWEVIKLRFGLNGRKAHTLKAIGDGEGVTAEAIRQRIVRILGKLRGSEIVLTANKDDLLS